MQNDDMRRVFFEQHPDPMWVFEQGTLRFLDVNDAAIRRYGWTRAEFLSMTIADIRPPEDVARLREHESRFQGGRDEAGVWRHRLRSGAIVHVDIVAHSIQYDGRAAELVCARDVTHLIELNARLGEANEMVRYARELAKLGAWSVAVPDGPLSWSPETAAIHELPEARTLELSRGIEFYAPEFRDRIRAVFARCVEQGVPYDEIMQIVTARGRRLWVRTIGEPVHGPDGRVVEVRGAFQDVSELMLAREREADATRQLASTLEHISDAFMTLDDDWRITYMNGNAERLLGRSRGELLWRSVWESFPDAVGSVFHEQYERAQRTRQPARFAAYAMDSALWVRVAAYPFPGGLAVYLRNATRERVREEQLRLLEAAVGRVNDGLLITEAEPLDWPDGPKIVYVNDAFVRLTGYTREEVIGRTPRLLQGPNTDPEVRARIGRALRAWQPIRVELVNYRKSGEEFWAELEIVPLADANGWFTHWVAVQRDVTERRAVESQLRQAQKLEAVGQLTGGIAHDFNNLLTVVLGSAELLARQAGEQAQLRKLADTIVLAAGRGADLTKRLLAFARRQALAPRIVDAGQLIAGMDPLLRRVLVENVDVRIVRGLGLWLAEIDPGQLEVALLNLAINARDAMPEGGRIVIEAANVRLERERPGQADGPAPGEYVAVSVSDTGIGMTPDVLEHAFEPFFTTKEVGRGTGLGLSMVYGFAKQSGGHVRIDSVVGRGTTVRLYFPRALPAVERPADAGRAVAVRGGNEHVLLVEDEALVREHAVEVLRELGYRVSAAANGAEALERLAAERDIDLLFTDLVMPGGMNGRQLAEQARRLRPGLRVLYTSGYADDTLGVQHAEAPGAALLSKPYRRDELAAKLREVLDAATPG